MSLLERLDFRREVTRQLTTPRERLAYSGSGAYVTCAIVWDHDAILGDKLYRAPVVNTDEARYLSAIFSSNALTLAVRPLQSMGQFGPRDFNKTLFQLPIPLYDPDDSAHRWLVALAERAEEVAAGVELPDIRFDALRRRVREALVRDGVAADIDGIVRTMLARSSTQG